MHEVSFSAIHFQSVRVSCFEVGSFFSAPSPAFIANQKKAGVAILISDKIDFEIKAVKRGKEGHYIVIKGSIQEDDITIICNQHRSTTICKTNANKYEKGN